MSIYQTIDYRTLSWAIGISDYRLSDNRPRKTIGLRNSTFGLSIIETKKILSMPSSAVDFRAGVTCIEIDLKKFLGVKHSEG
jgi:hypothetical protein